MAEKLNAFIALYSKKAEERLAKSSADIEQFKKLRAEAIAYKDIINFSSGNTKYSSLGELVAAIYPEEGGVNNDIYVNLYGINKKTFDEEKVKVIDAIYKVRNSPTQYKNNLAVKEQGGEKYFKGVRSAITGLIANARSKGSTITFDSLIGKNNTKDPKEEIIEEFYYAIKDSVNDSEDIIDGPGVLNSAELYDAIVEAGDPTSEASSKSSSESPINQTDKASSEKKTASSTINQTTGESPDKKVESASITETGKVAKEPETESKVVSKTESINEPKPGEKLEGETAKKETAPGKTPVEEKKATAGTINIGEKESAELDKREKEEKQKQAKISNVVQNLKITDESKKSKVTDILTRFSESKGKEPSTEPSGSLNESLEKGKEVAQSLGKIGAPSTTVNQASTTTQASTASTTTANFENTQSTSTSQTINQTDQSKTSTSSAPVTNTSSKKTLTEAQQNIINDYKQKMGILTPEEKKIRAELEQSVKIESGSATPMKAGETVVEKGKTAFNEKVPANTQNTFASTQNTQNLNQTLPQPEKRTEVTKTEIAAAPVQAGAEPSVSTQQSAPMDVSRLEQRLRNLEEILSSPLSVKVV
jgi:hypothetical protein